MGTSAIPGFGALAGLSLAAAMGAVVAAEPRPAAVPASGVGLGWGWHSEREVAIPSICVEFDQGEDLAQTARLTIQEVSDRSELMEKLNISASVAVDAIAWSANASAAFAKSVEMKQTSSTFLLRAEIDNGLVFTAPKSGDPQPGVRLTPRARALIQADGNAFLDECGDSFVWGIRGGAELNAAITFSSRSLQEKEDISAEMSGSYSFVRGTGKFGKNHDAKDEAEEYAMTSVQIGGSRGQIPGSREKLLEKLDSLAGEAAERPKPVGILVASYRDLPSRPVTPLPSDTPADDQRLASYWRYTTLYEDIEAILNNQAGFMLNRGATVASLEELQDQVAGIRKAIEKAVRQIDASERAEGPFAVTASLREMSDAVRDALATTNQATIAAAFERPQDSLRALTGPAAQEVATALAEAESLMVPIEDLLTRMPLPYADPTQKAEDDLTDREVQRAIVDYYIGRPAKRRCAVAATAPGCLSNDAIEGYRLQVPTGPKDLTRHGDPAGYGSGARFGEVPLYSVLDARLVRVSIHHNAVGIRGLELTYKTPDGREETIGKGAPTRADETTTLELAEDERLAGVSGLWLPVAQGPLDLRHVIQLEFTTTRNRKASFEGLLTQPGFDAFRFKATPFRFQPKEGEEIFALSGRLHQVHGNRHRLPELVLLGLLEPVYRKTR
jgi:hypothetical protein